MGKNSTDVYRAVGKGNLLRFNPEDLTLVTDPEHPLYDERVHLPLREETVLNIMHAGVIEPITIRKNKETGDIEVVAGRQRVKHAIEANKRLKKEGREPITVNGIVEGGDDDRAQFVMASENEHRQDDTPLGRAQKMQRMLQRGVAEQVVAVAFGCTVQTVKQATSLLSATAAVQTAVERGQVGVAAA